MIARTSLADASSERALDHRPRLLGLAYRMLGDMDEAEDVVQEAFLRWQQTDQHIIRSAEAWLVTVVSRLSVDRLRRLSTERATYPGPWLPEPIAMETPLTPNAMPAPDRRAEMASDLSIALLLLLERLAPEERAAFLLREVFGTNYAEIARILARKPDAVRQMVHRARNRVHTDRPRVDTPAHEHQQILEQFLAALSADDAPALLALLAPGVELASDGGGRARAARNWITGPDHVSRFMLGVAGKKPGTVRRLTKLNGESAYLTLEDGRLTSAITIRVVDGCIRAVHIVRNPDKLRHAIDAVGPIA